MDLAQAELRRVQEVSMNELIEKLKDEQHKVCAYGTREGDDKRCDCKYNPYPHAVEFRGEITGCPELRSAIRVLQALNSQ